MNILSLFNHIHAILNFRDGLYYVEHKKKNFKGVLDCDFTFLTLVSV